MNWLQNIQFEIHITRLPNLSFLASKVSIPGIDAAGPRMPSPFNHIPATPDILNYSNLSVTAMIDEKMEVWEEMFNWICMGFPEDYKQFDSSRYEKAHHSDISVIMLNSKKNKFCTFDFKNCIPVNMSPIDLDAQQTAATTVPFTIDFSFDSYSMNRGK